MPRRIAIPSLAWIFLAYALGLWLYSVPLTGDEKVYISTAMEMWRRHAWLHPWLLGQHSYFKPPFQYWATLAGWSILGFGQLGTFLPSILATVGTCFFLCGLSESLLGMPRHEATSPLWFAACAGTLTYGTTAQMEIWIAFFYTGAWWAALRARDQPGGGARWLCLALLFAGLLSLVKSPLYSVFWVLGYWTYLALGRDWRAFRPATFWLAHLLGILAGASWFAAVLWTDRAAFWSQYVVRETLDKYNGNSSSALHMWGDFSTFCVPYLLILPVILAIAARRIPSFLLAWALIPVLFFSVFPYRTETYLYILMPLMALAMDLGPAREAGASTALRLACRLNGVLMALLLAGAALITFLAGIVPAWLALLLAVAGGTSAALAWRPRWRALAFSYLAVIFLLRLSCVELGEQDIAGLRQVLASHPGRTLVFYDDSGYIWHEVGLLSVAVGRPSDRATSPGDLMRALADGRIVVLNDSERESLLPRLLGGLTPEMRARLRMEDWSRWKRGFQLPTPADLAQLGERGSPGWEKAHKRVYELVYLEGPRGG